MWHREIALFHRKYSNIKVFADINHQNIDIHHIKNQTKILLSSCSILDLKKKNPLMLKSQCSLVPFLKNGLCKVRNHLDKYDFQVK